MIHNHLDYLLIMSIQFKSYKEVNRDYLYRLLNEVNENCVCEFCTNCQHVNGIRFELFKKGYQTFNKHVNWWRINHHWGNVTVEPIQSDDKITTTTTTTTTTTNYLVKTFGRTTAFLRI